MRLNVHCAVKTVFHLSLGYFLRTPDNSNLFSISLEGSSYRESNVYFGLIVISFTFTFVTRVVFQCSNKIKIELIASIEFDWFD